MCEWAQLDGQFLDRTRGIKRDKLSQRLDGYSSTLQQEQERARVRLSALIIGRTQSRRRGQRSEFSGFTERLSGKSGAGVRLLMSKRCCGEAKKDEGEVVFGAPVNLTNRRSG